MVSFASPPTRAEWIEISADLCALEPGESSPPTRAEWIEIKVTPDALYKTQSPPTRAEWIEIATPRGLSNTLTSLRPHGRSGLKSQNQLPNYDQFLSPPTRAEWIEIMALTAAQKRANASPPTRAEWIEIIHQ